MASWNYLEFSISAHHYDGVCTLLWELGTSGIEERSLGSKRVRIRAFFPRDAEISTVSNTFLISCGKLGASLSRFSAKVQKDMDWLKKWRAEVKPFQVGHRFYIIPSLELDHPVPEARIPIWIEPGMAFGTGTHETTQLCLQSLEQSSLHDKTLLDVGAGSGILAIAAAKLGAKKVVACDIDSEAVAVSRSNTVINGCDREIELVVGDITRIGRNRFDFVVANLTKDLIVELLPQFISRLKPGGTLILSGILIEQVGLLRKTIQQLPFSILRRDKKGEWACLTLNRTV